MRLHESKKDVIAMFTNKEENNPVNRRVGKILFFLVRDIKTSASLLFSTLVIELYHIKRVFTNSEFLETVYWPYLFLVPF